MPINIIYKSLSEFTKICLMIALWEISIFIKCRNHFYAFEIKIFTKSLAPDPARAIARYMLVMAASDSRHADIFSHLFPIVIRSRVISARGSMPGDVQQPLI